MNTNPTPAWSAIWAPARLLVSSGMQYPSFTLANYHPPPHIWLKNSSLNTISHLSSLKGCMYAKM